MVFFFSSRRRHTRSDRDWSSDVCSSDLGARSARQRRGRRGARRSPGSRGGGSASGRDDRRGGSRSRRTTRGGGCPLDRSGRLAPRPRVAATLGPSRYAPECHVDRGHRGVVVTALVVALLLALATWLLLRPAGSRPNALPGDPRPNAASGRGDVGSAGARRRGRPRGSPEEAEAEALDLLDALAPALRAGLPPVTALRLTASSAPPDGGPTSGPSAGPGGPLGGRGGSGGGRGGSRGPGGSRGGRG